MSATMATVTVGGDEAMMRRYQSSLTRFFQPDPYAGSYSLAEPQSFNRYAYVQNDPVNFTDPTGLFMSINGDGDYSGGGWGSAVSSGMSSHISGAMASHDQLVQARIDGILAQHYLNLAQHYPNNGYFEAAQRIFDSNSNVGLFQDGAALWGEFASAFVGGYRTGLSEARTASIDPWRALVEGNKALRSAAWKAVANKLRELRSPDFKILNVNIIAGITRFIPRGDDMSTALHGLSAGGGEGQFTFAVGWMIQRARPRTEDIREWGKGLSVNADFFFIGGGGIVYSISNPTTLGVYVGVGIGGGGGAAFQYKPW
jgi:RHS repeat-associated protein